MLERRLRQIEDRLNPKAKGPKCEPQYMDLLDFSKETVVAALGILKDVGGYQLMLRTKELAVANKEELDTLNKLTPGQFYDLMVNNN
jgi:hypothetical protein